MTEPVKDALCPSCGRFVGTANRCPHCGAHNQKRLSIRVARWAAVAISVAGLIILWSVARISQVPPVKVGELTETMNFALVRLQGEVSSPAKVYFAKDADGNDTDKAKMISFTLADESGEITVLAFSAVAQAIWERREELLPRVHDEVDLTGSIRVKREEGVTTLSAFLQSYRNLSLHHRPIPEIALAEVQGVTDGEIVTFSGIVQSVTPPTKAPGRIVIADEEEQVTVVAWKSVYHQLRSPETLVERPVRVSGTVGHYKGRALQVQLNQPWDLVPLEAMPEASVEHASGDTESPQATPEQPGEEPLEAADEPQGEPVIAVGEPAAEEPPVQADPKPSPSPEMAPKGQAAEAKASQPAMSPPPTDNPVEPPAKALVQTPPVTGLAALETVAPGTEVRIRGTLRRAPRLRQKPGEWVYSLEDEDGTKGTLVVSQKVVRKDSRLWFLKQGDVLEATGLVRLHRKKREVLVREEVVGNFTGLPPLENLGRLDPGEIREEHKGKLVTVRGEAREVTDKKGNVLLELVGRKGSVKVFVPRSIFKALGQPISNGVRMSVDGKVDLYKESLEVIPGLPQNVRIHAGDGGK